MTHKMFLITALLFVTFKNLFDSIEALKYLFPRTDEERAAMLTGYPSEWSKQHNKAFIVYSLLGSLYQLPHPQTPELPLASDPNLDITGSYMITRIFTQGVKLQWKVPSRQPGRSAATLSAADQRRAASGDPAPEQPEPGTGIGGPGAPSSGLPGIGPGPASFGTGA